MGQAILIPAVDRGLASRPGAPVGALGAPRLLSVPTLLVLLFVLLLGGGPDPARAQSPSDQPPPDQSGRTGLPPSSAEPAADEETLPTETVTSPPELAAVDQPEEVPLREGSLEGSDGPPVARIEVRSDAPVDDTDELRDLITVTVGERLTEGDVRQTLRNLQATGAAYEVELYTRPAAAQELASPTSPQGGAPGDGQTAGQTAGQAAGEEAEPGSAEAGAGGAPAVAGAEGAPVVVVIAIRAAVRVESVRIEGELGIDRRTLEGRLLVSRGQPLIESRVLRSVYQLQELYENRGYFDATVRLSVDTDDARKLAAITFRVDAGQRSDIGKIRFDGDLGSFTDAQLAEHLRLDPGDPYRRETVRDAADHLQQWLVEQKYRKAEVDTPRVAVEEPAEGADQAQGQDQVREGKPAGAASGGGRRAVDLVYPVRVGPLVEVEIVGADRKELRKKDLLPFLSDEGYDEALVLQAVDRVRRYFQEQGHWKVDVTWDEKREDGAIRLVFTIDPGPAYTLQEVRFDGNEQVSDGKLFELMETAPKRLLTLGSGRLVTSTLDEDLQNIRSYYALQGYVGSKIGPAEPRVDGRDITLVIPIEEGHRRQVVDLDIEGMEHLDEADVRRKIPLASGGPFHPLLLEDTLGIIRGLYEEKGFPDAQVSSKEDWNSAGDLVDVTVQVIEGPRTVVDRVILRGNYRTADAVIERAVDLAPGDPVSRSSLLEVERRLYSLGLFSRVQVDLGPADLSERTRDVIVRVEEGHTHRVSYGLGYGTDDGFAGLFGYTHRNLWGRAVTLQTDLRYGQKQRLARIVFDQPNVTRWNLPFLYTVALQSEERPSYQVDRAVSQVEAVYQKGSWRYGLAFDYRIVNSTLDSSVVDLEGLDPLERRDQDVRISSVIPNLFVDRRDDPLEPTNGWTANLRFQYAFPLGSYTDAHFIKTFVQGTRYFHLAFGHVAGSVRLGFIEPLADATKDPTLPAGTPASPEPENLKIPIDERLFAGGDYSHRAYGKDALGIPDQTLFADGEGRGGNGLALINLDYRFPIWGALAGVVFYDAGNVWPDWQQIDPRELKSGIGVALRYITPIGPLRAGVAYKLDPEPGLDESDWRFFVAVGNPF